MWLVYILKDIDIPFYVGKGAGESRAYSHEKYAKSNNLQDLGYGLTRDYNPYKTRKIRKILQENRKIEYEFLPCQTEQEAFDLEIELIKKYGRANKDPNGILTNITIGGTGGDIWSSLTKEQQKDMLEKRKNSFDQLPEEIQSFKKLEKLRKTKITKDNLSEEEKAIAYTNRSNATRTRMNNMTTEEKETRAKKISVAHTGVTMGPSPKKGVPATGNGAKGVKQAWNKNIKLTDTTDPRVLAHKQGIADYWANADMKNKGQTPFKLIAPSGEIVEGNNPYWLIREYDLSVRVLSLISGEVKTYKGWIRFEDLGKVIPKKTNRIVRVGKPLSIDRFTMEEEYLDTWPSIKNAAINLNISPGTLSTRVATNKPYGGFIWRYHQELS